MDVPLQVKAERFTAPGLKMGSFFSLCAGDRASSLVLSLGTHFLAASDTYKIVSTLISADW